MAMLETVAIWLSSCKKRVEKFLYQNKNNHADKSNLYTEIVFSWSYHCNCTSGKTIQM